MPALVHKNARQRRNIANSIKGAVRLKRALIAFGLSNKIQNICIDNQIKNSFFKIESFRSFDKTFEPLLLLFVAMHIPYKLSENHNYSEDSELKI